MQFDWKSRDTWPDFLGAQYVGDEKPIPQELINKFANRYAHVLSYHGCRTEAPARYYESGVRSRSHESLLQEFLEIVRERFGLEVEGNLLSQVLETLAKSHEGRVFLALDDRHLIERAGHYMIYGSEFLLAVANHLEGLGSVINNDHLKSIGKPTIIEVSLPMEMIEKSDLQWLVTAVNDAIYENTESQLIDFTFELRKTLKPSTVVGSFHPEGMLDYHARS